MHLIPDTNDAGWLDPAGNYIRIASFDSLDLLDAWLDKIRQQYPTAPITIDYDDTGRYWARLIILHKFVH